MIEEQKVIDVLISNYNISVKHMKRTREEHKDALECAYEGYNEAVIMIARELGLADALKDATGAKVWGAARLLESRLFNQSLKGSVKK